MIELYIFDWGGVVVRDFDVCPEAARLLGISEDEFRLATRGAFRDYMRGSIGAPEFWDRFEREQGIRAGQDYIDTLFRPSLHAPTLALVDGIRRAGARAVAGTNTIDTHFARMGELGLPKRFDGVYASHLMGVAKPDPDFWLRILDAEGVRPERAFFVDDYPENVEAAKSIGIDARLYVDESVLGRDLAECLRQ
ncbi:MAG: HAD family phosphatase [Spirochaetes bacterium]|nr:HAD family phosphatase [Spirochaetota bacterium]